MCHRQSKSSFVMLKAMSIFCFLWVTLFYLFWRSIAGNNAAVGGVWALLAGTVVAVIQFLAGPFIVPEGFGLARWMSGFVDIVVLPALIPVLVYLFLFGLKIISGSADFTNFTLLWLIPGSFIRALGWISQRDPILLILVPVLWTSIAVGISFFISLIQTGRKFVIALSSLAIIMIPLAAASSYWAFFSQKLFLGCIFCIVTLMPLIAATIMSFLKAGGE